MISCNENPGRKNPSIEYMMHMPTCLIDTLAIAEAVVLQLVLGPVAPAHLVIGGSTE